MRSVAAKRPKVTGDSGAATILEHPFVSFGPEVAADLDAALRREWLVPNLLGGYASGTLGGVNTRRYHGLLVAALNPPAERTVLEADTLDWVRYDENRYALSTHEYGEGTIDPHGYRNIQSFELDGAMPVSIFAPIDEWYWNFRHREETARGLDDRSDLYVPVNFSKRLRAGDQLTLILTTEGRRSPSLCTRRLRRRTGAAAACQAASARRMRRQRVRDPGRRRSARPGWLRGTGVGGRGDSACASSAR
jgi:glycogen debranching enzyme